MDYQKTNWSYGDYVTPTKINNMENGLLSASQKINIDYTRTDWQSGDVVSADGLNNIEEGIERLSQAVDLVSEEAVLDEITPANDDISITVNNSGQISATYTSDEDLDIIHTPGIVTQNTVVHTNISKTETHQLNTQESTLITPTKSQQTAVQSGKFTTGDVVVDAIPNQYIIPTGKKTISENGTNIDVAEYENVDVQVSSDINNQNKTVNPTTSQQSITADSGYSGLGTVTVNAMPTGTAGTPTATKSPVSNHSVSVTPSVINTSGYITGGTKTGTAVSVNASELVSGSETKTENGTYDVTNLASLIVAVQKGDDIPIFSVDARQSTPTVTCNKTFLECYNLYNSNSTAAAIAEVTTQSATLKMAMSVLAAYTGAYVHYAIYNELGEPVADILYYANDAGTYTTPTALLGDAGTPTATKETVSNHSISVTPSVTNTTGYITGGTKAGTAVIVRASELVSGTLYCDDSGIWDVTNAKYFDVGSGTVNNPTATKGTVSNHSVTVTPSVTSSEGWISGGTKTGTAVSVSASELVSGTKSISSNGTNIDVTNYESVDVDVFSPTLEPLRVYSDNNHNDNDTIITPQTGHAFSSVKVDLDVVGFKLDTSETTLTEDSTSITFNNVFKEPFWYYIVCEDQTQFSSTQKYAFLVYKDKTSSNPCIRYIYSTTETNYTYDASQSFNYADSIFTITSTQSGVKFAANKKYTLVCMYNTRMYSTQSSKKEIDGSSNEFEINYLAQRPHAIYGYTNDGNTKQSSSEITSFFALISDDYEDYINQPTNSCEGSCVITTGQLVECTSDDLSVKINREEEYGSYNYNHSITISSSNFDFKSGTWSIFYIPYNGSPGELVSPEPYYINDSYGEGFTKNGVYYAEDYGYHGFNRIKINVPQKIEYEEGVYTPQSDEINPTIYFSSDHYFPPNQIIMVDTKKYDPEDETYTPIMPKTNSNIEWGFTYYGGLGGDTRTSPEVQYGSNEDDVILATVRKTSIQSNNTYNQTSYSLTASGLDDWNDATNDYADGTKFMPHTTSSNTVWEGGRSYYWIALWVPHTAVF